MDQPANHPSSKPHASKKVMVAPSRVVGELYLVLLATATLIVSRDIARSKVSGVQGLRHQKASHTGVCPDKFKTPTQVLSPNTPALEVQLQAASSVFPTATVEFTSDDAWIAQGTSQRPEI